MKEILENIFAVEVPDGAKQLHVEWNLKETNQYVAYKFKDDELVNEYEIKPLPPGSYEILFTTKDCTEEQAMKVVAWDMYEDVGILAANYMDDRTGDKKTCSDSLQSLLCSHGLDPNKNYLLLKKTH